MTEIITEMSSVNTRLQLTIDATPKAGAPRQYTLAMIDLRWASLADLFGRGMRVGSDAAGDSGGSHVLEPIRLALRPSFGHRGASVHATIPFW